MGPFYPRAPPLVGCFGGGLRRHCLQCLFFLQSILLGQCSAGAIMSALRVGPTPRQRLLLVLLTCYF